LEEPIVRMAARILGSLLALGGVVWILQGVNVLPGSFMTGDLRWAYRGAAALLVGIVLIIISFR
jgi:hypothetical protein